MGSLPVLCLTVFVVVCEMERTNHFRCASGGSGVWSPGAGFSGAERGGFLEPKLFDWRVTMGTLTEENVNMYTVERQKEKVTMK